MQSARGRHKRYEAQTILGQSEHQAHKRERETRERHHTAAPTEHRIITRLFWPYSLGFRLGPNRPRRQISKKWQIAWGSDLREKSARGRHSKSEPQAISEPKTKVREGDTKLWNPKLFSTQVDPAGVMILQSKKMSYP